LKHIIFGDSHLHGYVDFSTGVGTENSRLKNSLEVLEEVLNYAVSRKIFSVIHLGDLFDRRSNVQYSVVNPTFDLLHRFKNIGLRLKILQGNHDQVLKDGSLDTIHVFSSFINVIDFFTIQGNLAYCPYTSNIPAIAEFLSTVPKDKTVLGHFDVMGAVLENDFLLEKGLDRVNLIDFKAAILGHVHKRQHLSGQAWYIGCVCPQRVLEEDYVGSFIEYDDESGEITWHYTNAPRFTRWDGVEKKQLANRYVRVFAERSEERDEYLKQSGAVSWMYLSTVVKRPVTARNVSVTLADPLTEAVKSFSKTHVEGLDLDRLTELGLELLSEGNT
jgi:DNA repair exonuclease SbcCD nuclease subunit